MMKGFSTLVTVENCDLFGASIFCAVAQENQNASSESTEGSWAETVEECITDGWEQAPVRGC